MSSASEAFGKEVVKKGTEVSAAEIRREFAEAAGLEVTVDDKNRVMIDAQGVTVPCRCGLFDGTPENQKEAWRKCFIPQMIWTLMRRQTPDKEMVTSVEDFCHDMYEASERHKEDMA